MRLLPLVILLPFCFLSCTRAELKTPPPFQRISEEAPEASAGPAEQPLVLTFAGDLMAHDVNFKMKDYHLIYADVQDMLLKDDLSFINVETPVCDSLPLSGYPSFNVHTDYLRAAVHAGFDVLGFANNHTNDHGSKGIDGSLAAIRTVQKEYAEQESGHGRTVAFSGLKDTVDENLRITAINYKGRTILFCAVTEILNSYDSSKNRLYYSAPTKDGRAALLHFIKNARRNYRCDLFVLGLHLYEPEYIRTVSETKKQWFKQLGEAGVDIIWAHHPHVMQTWETITVNRPVHVPEKYRMIHAHVSDSAEVQITETRDVVCMYSMGNFISGQRWRVRYDDPAYYREYTGDAVLLQVQCAKKRNGALSMTVQPFLITQYNEPAYPVVKRFTPEWIESLNEKEKAYFTRRRALMREYLPF